MFVSKRYLAEGPGKLHRSFSCSRIACSVAKNLSVHPLARRTRLAAPSQPPAYRERLGTSKHGRRTLSRNRPQLVAAVGGGAAMLMNNDWWLWTALLGSSLVAEVVESTVLGKVISKPMIAILLGLAMANLGVIPLSCSTYDIIMAWCIPLAAVFYVLEADLSKLAKAGGRTLLAFGVGTVGTILGTAFAWILVSHMLGSEGWKIAAVLCATYVGGSINMIATADVVGLTSSSIFAAAFAADNIAMTLYLGSISMIPARKGKSSEIKNVGGTSKALSGSCKYTTWLFTTCCCCALGMVFSKYINLPAMNLAFATFFATLAGPLTTKLAVLLGWWNHHDNTSIFTGCEGLGSALTMLFFVTIGASCGDILGVFTTAPWIFAFISVQLCIHSVFTLAVCKRLKLPMRAILTASNANIGGPFTAAGMAGARGWDDMMQPAILIGSLGYAIGTVVGSSMGFILRSF